MSEYTHLFLFLSQFTIEMVPCLASQKHRISWEIRSIKRQQIKAKDSNNVMVPDQRKRDSCNFKRKTRKHWNKQTNKHLQRLFNSQNKSEIGKNDKRLPKNLFSPFFSTGRIWYFSGLTFHKKLENFYDLWAELVALVL